MAKAKKAKAKLKVTAKKTAATKKTATSKTKSVKKAKPGKAQAASKAKTKVARLAPQKAVTKAASKAVASPKKSAKGATTVDFAGMISPLDDRLVVRFVSTDGEDRKTSSGLLFIPDTAAIPGHQKATVLAIGRGRRSKKGLIRPLDVQVGDEVYLADFSGDEIELMGQKVKIVRESDVLGIVAESAEKARARK